MPLRVASSLDAMRVNGVESLGESNVRLRARRTERMIYPYAKANKLKTRTETLTRSPIVDRQGKIQMCLPQHSRKQSYL